MSQTLVSSTTDLVKQDKRLKETKIRIHVERAWGRLLNVCIIKLRNYLTEPIRGFCFVFIYHYFKDWKHIRKFLSVSLNTLWYIEKKYSINHDRIRSGNSSCRDNFVITCPSHKMPFKACMARIIVVFLHHSVTFSQRLTKHKACARFERSRKVPNEFGWGHF